MASSITENAVTIVLPVLNEVDAVSTVIERLEAGYTDNLTSTSGMPILCSCNRPFVFAY